MADPTAERSATLRTRGDKGLRVSERRYRAIFEQSPLGLVVYDPQGLLLEANQAIQGRVTPRSSRPQDEDEDGDAHAEGYNVLADPYLVEAGVMGDVRRAFAGEAVRLPPLYFDPERSPTPSDGPARWVRGFLYPIKDDAGTVHEVVAMVEDITEQRQAYQLLEQRVAERTQELSTLLALSQDVASTLELQPLLALILDHLRTLVEYTAAEILLLEGEYLVSKEYRGPLSTEQVASLRFPVAQAVGYQEVVRRGGPVIVDDLWGDAPLARSMREGPAAELYAIFNYARSIMFVPLMVQERIIGVVVFDHSAPHAYTPQHAALALAVANQAAVAIENARLYARAQEMAALEERARLARELHDSVTQTLFSASLIAEVLPRLWARDSEAGQQRLADLRLLTRGALAEMRTLLLELRPAALTEARLSDLLRQLAEALTGHKRLPVTVTVEGEECPLPPDVQVALYRVAQEALNNVAKHAHATRVCLSLRCGAGEVEVCIDDDGCGFEQERVTADHFGLRIMRERADAAGALLMVRSQPGEGAQVRVLWRGVTPCP